MKVVCAGNAKTGTKSITKALRFLGLTVYDWEEQTFDFLDHWVDVFQNGAKPDTKRVYEKADAAVDMPAPFFFEEILEAFPDCKVILSVRDEESWVKSAVNQLVAIESARHMLEALSPTLKKVRIVYEAYLKAFIGSDDHKSTYVFRKRSRIQNARVKAIVPPEKLLVYNVKQGWKPLCDFLGLKIPTIEFPHENIGGEIANTLMDQTRMGQQCKREIQQNLLLLCAVVITVVAVIIFIALKRFA